MRPTFPGFAAVCALLAVPALAGEQPSQRPSRDVAIEYSVSGMNPAGGGMGGGAGVMTMYFTNKGSLMRIEPPGGMGYTIMNADTGHTIAVMTSLKTYVEVAGGQAVINTFANPGLTFRKIGADGAAGLICTLYETGGNGRTGHVCLTDDGVQLRAQGGGPGGTADMEALKVTYAPQPATLFQIPAGFTKMEMPNLGALAGGAVKGGAPPNGFPAIK